MKGDGLEVSFLDDLDEKDTANGDALKELMRPIARLEGIDAEVAELEERLDRLADERKTLATKTIPTAMLAAGVRSVVAESGRKVEIKDELYCALPKDPGKRAEVLAWLEEHDARELIKDAFEIVAENPAQADHAREVLEASGVPYERDRTVNASSLKAYFKQCLGLAKGSTQRYSVNELPKAANVFLASEAKISG